MTVYDVSAEIKAIWDAIETMGQEIQAIKESLREKP